MNFPRFFLVLNFEVFPLEYVQNQDLGVFMYLKLKKDIKRKILM